MRIGRQVGVLLVVAAIAALFAAPAGAQGTRPGGTALEEVTDFVVFLTGLRALTDEVEGAVLAAAGPPSEAAAAPALALQAGVDQITASSGRPPFRAVNDFRCRHALWKYRIATRYLRAAPRFAARGRASLAEASQRRARSHLESGRRWQRSCVRAAGRSRRAVGPGDAPSPGDAPGDRVLVLAGRTARPRAGAARDPHGAVVPLGVR